MSRVYLKLAFSGVRRRRLQCVLSIVVIAASASALTIAFGVGHVADRPWERTFAATSGAHVVVTNLVGGVDLAPVAHRPGVIASTGVRPVVFSSFDLRGQTLGLRLIGVDPEPGPVAGPIIVSGVWSKLRGGVVLEQSFARFHDLHVGDRLTVGPRRVPLRVTGIGVIAQGQPYPRSQPGVGFALAETLARVQPDRSRWTQLIGVRLADPGSTESFVTAAATALGAGAHFADWRDERADSASLTNDSKTVLAVISAFFLVAGGAVLATLISGRVVAQRRELGLLKAAGLKPRQVALVVLLEQLALALAGTTLGILLGTIATPYFVAASASLLNASETPPLTVGTVVAVAAIVLGTVTAFALVPALRATRQTTAALVADVPRLARSPLGGYAERLGLPVSVAIGARDAFARPGRTALTGLSLVVTIVILVATLGMDASYAVNSQPPPAPALRDSPETPAWDPVDDDAGEADSVRPIVYGADALLVLIALTNLVATLLLALRERIRDLGLLKAVGLTPRQVTSSFLTAQGVLAAAAVVIGIPLGLAVFRGIVELAGGADEFAYPAGWSVALLAPACVAVVLAVSFPLARRASVLPAGKALRYE